MTFQVEVSDIIVTIRKALASSLNERLDTVSVELKELSKNGLLYTINGTFKVAPFFITRSGKLFVTLLLSERGLEITSLKIEEAKGL
jgi:VIT1/CCC1 family predicted Fe2+/Mn2+ transporter